MILATAKMRGSLALSMSLYHIMCKLYYKLIYFQYDLNTRMNFNIKNGFV